MKPPINGEIGKILNLHRVGNGHILLSSKENRPLSLKAHTDNFKVSQQTKHCLHWSARTPKQLTKIYFFDKRKTISFAKKLVTSGKFTPVTEALLKAISVKHRTLTCEREETYCRLP